MPVLRLVVAATLAVACHGVAAQTTVPTALGGSQVAGVLATAAAGATASPAGTPKARN